MRLFFTIFFVLISNVLYADDTNVIELHETKTLDQLVLEGNLKEESITEEETIIVKISYLPSYKSWSCNPLRWSHISGGGKYSLRSTCSFCSGSGRVRISPGRPVI
mgnify:CR=1 FL=1